MPTLPKTGLLLIGCLLSFVAHGQENVVAYGQENAEVPLGTLPTQYNAGFAGETGSPRLNTVTGLLLSRENTGYKAYAAYDQFFPAIRSGIGIAAGYNQWRLGDKQPGSYHYSNRATYIAVAVAPKFSVGGKVTLSPSIDASLHWGRNASTSTSGENRDHVSNTLRSRIGLLLNTEKFYVGYAMHLVDRFSNRLRNDTASWQDAGRTEKITSYWQFGYTFGPGTQSRFSFTPQLVFRTGTDRYAKRGYVLFSPVDFNLNFRYNKIIWGVNKTGVHIGWQTDKLRIMLSDNLQYTSRYEPGYIANIALRYIFKE